MNITAPRYTAILMRTPDRNRALPLAAACGLIVSIPILFFGSYVMWAIILGYFYEKRFADLHPELKLHPASMFFTSDFLFFSITVLLSILCTATAAGILRRRNWAIASAAFAVPVVSWLTFFGTLWAYRHAPVLPSGALFVVGPGLVLAILTFYVLPWFLVISLWWLILFRSARSRRWNIGDSSKSGASASPPNQ